MILLLHPDLDGGGWVPGDEVVAGDDLVWTIPVLSNVVALTHHRWSLETSVASLMNICYRSAQLDLHRRTR